MDARPCGSSVPFPARLGAQRGLCCWVGADRRERAAGGRPRTGSPLPYVSEGSLPPDPASLACSIAPGRRRARAGLVTCDRTGGAGALGGAGPPACGMRLLPFNFLCQTATERALGQFLLILSGGGGCSFFCLISWNFLRDVEAWSGPRITRNLHRPGAERVNFCASLPSSLRTLAGTEHLSVAMAAVHLKGMTG